MAHEAAGFEEFIHSHQPVSRRLPVSGPDLSALVSARLCHDLISPMGAIGNGLELLQLARGPGADELSLINDSLANALAKLRFFRVAFGPADPQVRQSFDEAAQITDATFYGRFSVTWKSDEAGMPRATARLIYLAVLCIEKSLPMGGAVQVSIANGAASLSAEGRKVSPPAELWAHVTDGAPLGELRSDAVQFPLLREHLASSGHRIEVAFTETGARIEMKALSPKPA
jgi:histidine phosphotransferase ChpT